GSGWAGGFRPGLSDSARMKEAAEGGVAGMWMPPVTPAWSIARLGGRGKGLEEKRRFDEPVPPQAWEEAKKTGIYVLDEHGRLLPAIRDTVRICADHGVALSFGHLSPPEMEALAAELSAAGGTRAFLEPPSHTRVG